MERANTLGELKASGYRPLSVKDEMRRNVSRLLREGGDILPGIVGYEKTVVPQIVNAVLARHDFILLGLRGQAKTRILRTLTRFLDDAIPAVDGCPINDDPLKPICKACRRRLHVDGDRLSIRWIPRDERYREKLATPDVTIADLIGDIDPVKAATERLTYSDEEAIHYGIIPRTNRGIFAINELPDLAPRIQVGLLNILQEGDLQIRGFPLRIPLDIVLVFSANPEDYTNRGNIITPLRDRIDSQIKTHYPLRIEDGMRITDQEAWVSRSGVEVSIPPWFREIVETVAVEARKSEFVDQNSGVSARVTITALELLVSNVERRALRLSESRAAARICDLQNSTPAIMGKVELVYEGEQEGPIAVARHLLGKGVKSVFLERVPEARKLEADQSDETPFREVLDWFQAGHKVEITDELPTVEYVKRLEAVKGLRKLADKHLKPSSPEELGAAMEFLLEGLHQCSMVAREDQDLGTTYRDMLGNMLSQLKD
ncbi:MAG: magnesium chelatase [Planctomycetes bacterium]|nr:magnesium chelatase [Planctomycetota bacterium]MBI3845709.1 magnesium chelatase [Planctomycetota bacterium]